MCVPDGGVANFSVINLAGIFYAHSRRPSGGSEGRGFFAPWLTVFALGDQAKKAPEPAKNIPARHFGQLIT